MAFSLFKKKPAAAMGEAAKNDLIRAALAGHGDDGSAVRHVVHYAYPQGQADLSIRARMIADLQGRGYAVKDAASLNGLVFEHHRPVAADDFDQLTVELAAWFAARGWDYDGWECAVAQAQSQAH